MFGNTNQNKSFGFGFMPSQSVLFAQQPQQPTEFSLFQSNRSMTFGNNFFESETTGTVIKFTPVTDTYTMQSNGTTQLINTKYHSITLMKEYKNKSFEELRFEDYSANRKGPQQTSFQNTSFTVSPTTIFSILRQTDNKPVFGQTPVFGSFNPTSPPNFFKESYTFGVPPSIPGLDFNLTLASKLFDSNQTHRPPFQSLFGTAATQVQSTFGTEQFGQTNTQNTASNFSQKLAQPTTGLNADLSGSFFNQPGNTHSSNLFQDSKPNTSFGLFKQTSTGPTEFGQSTQPGFGPNFGKVTTSDFLQPTRAPFAIVLPQTIPSFSQNVNQQQQAKLQPEPMDKNKNIFLYGSESKLGDSSRRTTYPQNIKAFLNFSKKRRESFGTQSKLKVELPRPKRGTSHNQEFFERNRTSKISANCFVNRKFTKSNATILDKYKKELIEEKEKSLKSSSKTDGLLNPRSLAETGNFSKVSSKELQFYSGVADNTKSSKLNLTFDKPYSSKSLSKSSSYESKSSTSVPHFKGSLGLTNDEIATEANFDLNTLTNYTDNTENPANVVLTRPEYYMYPPLKDLHKYMNENGECIVQGLTIGRRGYGNVYFSDPINISNMNFDEIVHFRYREIDVYPDDDKKPPFGEGLNRTAEVTLDKVYPRAKGSRNYVTDVDEIIKSDFVDNLIKVTLKLNSKFVDYRPETGSWVFRVEHFSKYAFTYDDEKSCKNFTEKVLHKKALDNLKKHDITEDQSAIRLGENAKTNNKPLFRKPESFAIKPNLLDF